MITLTVRSIRIILIEIREVQADHEIFCFSIFYSGKNILKMAAGDYSNGKDNLITLTVFTFTLSNHHQCFLDALTALPSVISGCIVSRVLLPVHSRSTDGDLIG